MKFNEAKAEYEAALTASGFKNTMKFNKTPKLKRNRSRTIIWFNPPYSRNVKTNIGNVFLKIIKKHWNIYYIHPILMMPQERQLPCFFFCMVLANVVII